MVIAALICFAALLVAWMFAPDEGSAFEGTATVFEPELAPAT